jgi:3-deoxy-D-manno-octulosonic-acid transferase
MTPILQRVTWIGAQTPGYARRFVDLGADPERVVVTGSVKFDGAETDRSNARTRQLARLAGVEPSNVVFLAGSTQEPEERLALEAFQRLAPSYPQLRLILVPRHPERFDDVADLLRASAVRWQRRSLLTEGTTQPAPILLVDTIGELGAWWGVAHLAYVGGSMGDRGGQNMIEPAGYGAAVSFGPNTWNFRDVVQRLLQAEAAVVVNDGAALTAFVHRGLEDARYRQHLGENAQRIVRDSQGAARQTCEQLRQLLLPAAARSLRHGMISRRADSTLSRKSA